MTILNATELSMSFGEQNLFENVSFKIEHNDKIGFVGANGCGKTTLIKILTGELSATFGTIAKSKGMNIGYLEQHACSDPDKTALDDALTIFSHLIDMEEELKKINIALSSNQSSELLLKQSELQEKFIAEGGLTYLSRTRAALLGLGLRNEEINLPVLSLSGGQRAKVGLAKLLLSNPKLILLDEPTNHLDIDAIHWLEEYLMAFEGAVLIISHDRYFLDKITNRTFHLKHQRLVESKGNYSRHLELEAERKLSEERVYENTIKEIKRIEGIIAKQKTFSMERNYRTIDHKQKSIDRLEKTLVKPETEEKGVHFKFDIKSDTGNDVLKAENLSKFYGDKVLYDSVCLDIKRKEHIFLLGPNGTGKTTLLKDLLNSENVKFGARVSVGYFDQMQGNLNPQNTVLDEVWNEYTYLSETTIRSALAAFLFEGDEVFSKIETLSGGERARVALCKLMLSGNNLLFLDEPTNHLDLRSREALEKALLDFDGTIIAVSHDRYFINRLATRILYLQNGNITSYSGNYDDFLERREKIEEIKAPKKEMGAGGKEYHLRKQQKAEQRKLKTKVQNLEKEIAELEEKIENLNLELSNPEISADYEKTLSLSEELDNDNIKLEQLIEEWDKALKLLEEVEE